VLTPVRNEEEHVRDVFETMRAQHFDGELEFIFIDGRSEDRSPEILRELAREDPRVRLIDNPTRRTPQALNLGLSAARGEFVARMDAHTYYPPDYLRLGVDRLRRGGAEHVSGPQLAHGVGMWSRRVALALSSRLGTGGAEFRRRSEGEIEVDSGFTGIWRRSTLEQQGGWDEGWWNDQDSELAARIRKTGGRIICLPEMAAHYVPRDSLATLARQYWRYGHYRAKTSVRHPETMRRSHVLAPGLALTLAGAVLGSRVARGGLIAYALAVLGVSASALPDAEDPLDVASLPLVFLCMHVPWGFGFLAGCVRWGPPVQALSRLLR
jgi:cellulose synthase/poly-beta-1,6-N-acetylglucosamine synthase-like glycosyltransferase